MPFVPPDFSSPAWGQAKRSEVKSLAAAIAATGLAGFKFRFEDPGPNCGQIKLGEVYKFADAVDAALGAENNLAVHGFERSGGSLWLAALRKEIVALSIAFEKANAQVMTESAAKSD